MRIHENVSVVDRERGGYRDRRKWRREEETWEDKIDFRTY